MESDQLIETAMLVRLAAIAILAVLLPSAGKAGQITSGFVSHHSDPPHVSTGMTSWRENNWGIGYKWNSGFMVTGFVNSENRPAAVGVYEEELARARIGLVSIGARAGFGAAIGYRDMSIAPVGYPAAFVSVGPVELTVGHNFKLSKRVPAVTWLQLRLQLE